MWLINTVCYQNLSQYNFMFLSTGRAESIVSIGIIGYVLEGIGRAGR